MKHRFDNFRQNQQTLLVCKEVLDQLRQTTPLSSPLAEAKGRESLSVGLDLIQPTWMFNFVLSDLALRLHMGSELSSMLLAKGVCHEAKGFTAPGPHGAFGLLNAMSNEEIPWYDQVPATKRFRPTAADAVYLALRLNEDELRSLVATTKGGQLGVFDLSAKLQGLLAGQQAMRNHALPAGLPRLEFLGERCYRGLRRHLARLDANQICPSSPDTIPTWLAPLDKEEIVSDGHAAAIVEWFVCVINQFGEIDDALEETISAIIVQAPFGVYHDTWLRSARAALTISLDDQISMSSSLSNSRNSHGSQSLDIKLRKRE